MRRFNVSPDIEDATKPVIQNLALKDVLSCGDFSVEETELIADLQPGKQIELDGILIARLE